MSETVAILQVHNGHNMNQPSSMEMQTCFDTDNGKHSFSDEEPAGMLESSRGRKVSPCHCANAQPCTAKLTSYPNADVIDSSTSPCEKTAGTLSELRDDSGDDEKRKASLSKCRLAHPHEDLEEEFFGSTAAQAVRDMVGEAEATKEKLLQALTAMRRREEDCSIYPKNASQLLEALDSLNVEGSVHVVVETQQGGCLRRCRRCMNQDDEAKKNEAVEDEARTAENHEDAQQNVTEVHLTEVTQEPSADTPDVTTQEPTPEPAPVPDTQTPCTETTTHTETAPRTETIPHPETPHCTETPEKEKTADSELSEDTAPTTGNLHKTENLDTEKQKSLTRYRLLLAENRRLKRRQLCRLCLKSPANATLLPCGHLVYCLDCAQTLNHCGVCHKEILGDVRTFLS